MWEVCQVDVGSVKIVVSPSYTVDTPVEQLLRACQKIIIIPDPDAGNTLNFRNSTSVLKMEKWWRANRSLMTATVLIYFSSHVAGLAVHGFLY
jgi:hypothetical protein